MTQKLDLRGLICPEPVLRTKKLLDNPDVASVEVLVDDDICVSNLQRLSKSLKAKSVTQKREGHYLVTIEKHNIDEIESVALTTDASLINGEHAASQEATVIFMTKETLGEGEPQFSHTLTNLFLQTILDSGLRPKAILMANSGVKLIAPTSPVLQVLKDFKDKGCEVLACGLCLEFYGLKEEVPKEQITNMFAICEYLFAASKVITP